MRLYQLNAARIFRSCKSRDGGYTKKAGHARCHAVTYADECAVPERMDTTRSEPYRVRLCTGLLGPGHKHNVGEHGVAAQVLWAHCQHGMMQNIGSAAPNITTTTLVSGQAQQIFLGFVLGLSGAVADSGIIRCRKSRGREKRQKLAARCAA